MSDNNCIIFWFRRDLRLNDNIGLNHAASLGISILPLFIFDSDILGQLEDPADRRVHFIHQAVTDLDKQLRALQGNLLVRHGKPVEVFRELIKLYPVSAVYFNHDYEAYARRRDAEVAELLFSQGILCRSFKDQVIFEKNEVIKEDGSPYTVFSAYSGKWKKTFEEESCPVKKYLLKPLKIENEIPALSELGFKKTDIHFSRPLVNSEIFEDYSKNREQLHPGGGTKLGIHLRFGTVSIRELLTAAENNPVFLNEIIWRDFFFSILWHFPHAENSAFKRDYDKIAWRNEEDEFLKWCKGETGYPMVDAGMRQLNESGYMPNRVRMVAASFLVKHLLIDWRWGEAWFAQKLLDFDLAANNGNWQWVASSGCDAAPYFRIFNPVEQQKRFDPKLEYCRNWIPELGTASYPEPMVENSYARQRTLAAYKKALRGS